MKFENAERKRDGSDIVTLSRHEANKFVDILKILTKSSRINSEFNWIDEGADERYTNVQVCCNAKIYENEDITPESLTDIMVAVVGVILIDDDVKIQGEEA